MALLLVAFQLVRIFQELLIWYFYTTDFRDYTEWCKKHQVSDSFAGGNALLMTGQNQQIGLCQQKGYKNTLQLW